MILDPVQMEYQAENKKMLDVYHRSKEQRYAFDKIFREESQEEVLITQYILDLRTHLQTPHKTSHEWI